jgi:hypothetical protein
MGFRSEYLLWMQWHQAVVAVVSAFCDKREKNVEVWMHGGK